MERKGIPPVGARQRNQNRPDRPAEHDVPGEELGAVGQQGIPDDGVRNQNGLDHPAGPDVLAEEIVTVGSSLEATDLQTDDCSSAVVSRELPGQDGPGGRSGQESCYTVPYRVDRGRARSRQHQSTTPVCCQGEDPVQNVHGHNVHVQNEGGMTANGHDPGTGAGNRWVCRFCGEQLFLDHLQAALLLYCRHLVICEVCAVHVRVCPVCEEVVRYFILVRIQ